MSGARVFRRVLVANRGEIAVRVIRTCRRLGIESVLTVSDADIESLPARLADAVIRIGPAPAADSYLSVDAIVGAALAAGVDAVHPGYGFLSENARLARACAAAGIVFIGPTPETLEATGDKLAAREHAAAAGLPILPGGRIGPVGHRPALFGPVGHRAGIGGGSEASGTTRAVAGAVSGVGEANETHVVARNAAESVDATVGADSAGEAGAAGNPGAGDAGAGNAGAGDAGAGGAAAWAEAAGDLMAAGAVAGRIGFPVLVKAAGGGGGRGLRVVREAGELAGAVAVASAEAGAAFGDPRVYLERYVERGRHVEVQILGDGERVIHLGDRDCSVQRRYQKLIEEAPAPGLDPGLRDRLRAAAVALGVRLRYRGAGTVEFLVDGQRGEFYFLEVNARIQVEHPVTEAITGLDLVAEQIAIAEGRPLRLAQEDVRFDGHAIECRINAEDPDHDFRPSPGTVTRAVFAVGPGGVARTWNQGDLRGERAGHSVPDGRDGQGGPDEQGRSDERSGDRLAGIRVDTHVQAGAGVPAFYDSLLAKVIAYGADREEALGVLQKALARCDIEGVVTNLGMQRAVVGSAGFAKGGVDTGFLRRWLAAGKGDGDGAESAGTVRGQDGVDLD